MKTNFSPGPWKYCGDDRKGCKCGQVWSIPNDHPVATAEIGEWGDTFHEVVKGKDGPEVESQFLSYGVVPEREGKANALLIAAAPELYSALENILTVWKNEGKIPGWIRRWEDAQNKALEALEKATRFPSTRKVISLLQQRVGD